MDHAIGTVRKCRASETSLKDALTELVQATQSLTHEMPGWDPCIPQLLRVVRAVARVEAHLDQNECSVHRRVTR